MLLCTGYIRVNTNSALFPVQGILVDNEVDGGRIDTLEVRAKGIRYRTDVTAQEERLHARQDAGGKVKSGQLRV